MRFDTAHPTTGKQRTKFDPVPWVLMLLICASVVVFTLVAAQAQVPADGTIDAKGLFHIDKSIVAMLGVMLALSSAAVGWGLAMGRIRAHCEDDSKHQTLRQLDDRYYSKGEIDATMKAGIAEMSKVVTEKMMEFMRRRDG